jgi:hypothetical protein
MNRLGIHKRWTAKFLQRELDIRVTEYAKLDPERHAAALNSERRDQQRLSSYLSGDEDTDLIDASFALEYVGRQSLRKAMADLLGRRSGASVEAVHAGALEVLLSDLLWAGRWRCTQGLPPRGYLFELKEFVERFSIAMSLGWIAQADKLHELVVGLEPVSPLWSKETFDPRWEKPREPWGRFTLALCSQFYGQPLPAVPPHPYESPAFDALLACWRDPDPSALVEPLLAVCDWHTHECMYSRSDRPSKNVDFINDVLMSWPVEVHTVLRLRERLGLALPPLSDHPLMQTPMGAYTAPQALPHDERLRGICQRAVAELPSLQSLLGEALAPLGLEPVTEPAHPVVPVTLEDHQMEYALGLGIPRLTFSAMPPGQIHEFQELAQEAPRIAREHFGMSLDGSVSSVVALDDILGQLAAHVDTHQLSLKSERVLELVTVFAAYVGELMCRSLPGDWQLGSRGDSSQPCVRAARGNRPVVFPIARVVQRLAGDPTATLAPLLAAALRQAAVR